MGNVRDMMKDYDDCVTCYCDMSVYLYACGIQPKFHIPKGVYIDGVKRLHDGRNGWELQVVAIVDESCPTLDPWAWLDGGSVRRYKGTCVRLRSAQRICSIRHCWMTTRIGKIFPFAKEGYRACPNPSQTVPTCASLDNEGVGI
jgi:hypothetical protein